ncbi:MAG: fibronectin type III domain-containing protein [Eubacterium sp.]|nr:fibronectin type III domain-containing protein [Eubacterium sp.]
MKLNKIISVFLAISLLFSSALFTYAQETKTEVSVQNGVVGFKDEVITVPVNISGNEGIMGYKIGVEYDPGKLEIKSVSNGLSGGSNFNDSISNTTNGSFFVVWNSTENVNENGILFNIEFKVLSTQDEISEIKLFYSQPDTFDEAFKDVELVCHNGFAVLNSNAHSFSKSVVEPSCTEDGYTIYKCNECDLFYKTDSVSAKGHQFSNNAKTCSACGALNPNYKEPGNNPSGSGSSTQTDTKNKNTSADSKNPVADKKTTVKKLTRKKKAILVKWKKVSGITGYQLQYSTKKSFSKKTSKKINIKSAKKSKYTIKKLKRNKKYFVRIRTYKTVKGKKYYSKWSKAKPVTTK